jgi:translation initiation factor 3 subunit M
MEEEEDVALAACIQFLETHTQQQQLGTEIRKLLDQKEWEKTASLFVDALIAAFNHPPPEKRDDINYEESLEGCVQVILNFIFSNQVDKHQLILLAQQLRQSEPFGPLRLRTVTRLYNALPETKETLQKLDLFILTVQVASKVNMLQALAPAFSRIEGFLDIWSPSKQDRRRVYQTITEAFDDTNHQAQAFEFHVKLLETFNGENEDMLSSIEPYAVKACKEAIRQPKLFRFDELLDLDAIQRLKNTKEHALLFELLQIFVSDKLEAFVDYVARNREYFDRAGFDYEACLNKMRLLSLASLGVEHSEIPYALAANTLQIEQDMLEHWVIEAVRLGLMEAKIDQMSQVIRVIRASQRVFVKEHWHSLQKRLEVCRSNVSQLIATIDQVRQQHLPAVSSSSSSSLLTNP